MQKVITINLNLNGNAYQLDEHGYEALHAYLERAEAQLGANPDKAEIIRDLEQSVAEKCMRQLGPGKSVVTAAEIEQILRKRRSSWLPPGPPTRQPRWGGLRRGHRTAFRTRCNRWSRW